MSFWKGTADPEAVPAAVSPPQQEGSGWWTRLKDRVMGEPEPLEVEEPSLLQQAREATTLNRVCMHSHCSANTVMQGNYMHYRGRTLCLALVAEQISSCGCRCSGYMDSHSVWAWLCFLAQWQASKNARDLYICLHDRQFVLPGCF